MLSEIITRIEARLTAVGLKESAAAKKAGLSDSAIRDMRRAIKAGKDDAGVSTRTLEKLAPVLETSVAWLVDGSGPENAVLSDPAEINLMLQRVSGLKPENIGVVLSMITGFQQANAGGQPQPAPPGDRSAHATVRREVSPSR